MLSLISYAQSKCFASSISSFLCPCTMARAVGMPISVGMTVSIPYARAKEVLPVGRPGVVQ